MDYVQTNAFKMIPSEALMYEGLVLFDCHMHLSGSVEYLQRIMDFYHIKKALVIPFDFNNYDHARMYHEALSDKKSKAYINNVLKDLVVINERFLNQVKGFSEFIKAGWLSPECSGLESIIQRLDVGKFIPSLDNLTSDYVERVKPLVSELVSNGKVVMIHTGWHANPSIVGELASAFPEGQFIMAHSKEDDDSYKLERMKVLKECANVYLELSYLQGSNRLIDYLQAGFEDQLLFGSDFMGLKYAKNISRLVSDVKNIYQDNDASKILYQNAEKLFT